MPSICTVSSISRIASTAAPSAASFWPSPTQRAAAIAPYSVTRTSSMARLRSGREPLTSGIGHRLHHAGRLACLGVVRLPNRAAHEDHVRGHEPDEVAGLDVDLDAVAGPPEDDAVEQDQRAGHHADDHRHLAGRPAERRL